MEPSASAIEDKEELEEAAQAELNNAPEAAGIVGAGNAEVGAPRLQTHH